MGWAGIGAGGLGGAGLQGPADKGAAPGVPFAGIPPDLRPMVEKLTACEPEFELEAVPFTHVAASDEPAFTMRRFLRPQLVAIVLLLPLIAVETVLAQLGPRLSQIAIDRGVLRDDFDLVARMVAVFLGSVALAAVVGPARTLWSGRIAENLLYGLRVRVFAHLQRLSLDFYTDEKAGRIMTRVTSDIEALQTLFQQGLVMMVIQLGTLAFVISQLFAMDAGLAAVVTLGVVPVLVAVTLWYRSASDAGYRLVRDRVALVLADLQENLSGNRVVAAHNRGRYNAVAHDGILGEYRTAGVYTARVGGLYAGAAVLTGIAAQGLVLLVGGHMVLDGRLSLGRLTAFVLYLAAFFLPIQSLTQLYNVYQQGQAAVAKLRELFATQPSVQERPNAVALPPITGAIELEGVTFGYDPDRPVLRDVDLTIQAGETFALVGPTGAGKSTVVKLLPRFYDPQHGRVLVDGHDIRDVTLTSLRSQLGVVPQEAFLFAGTIGDNIAFARPDATADDVMAACRAVGIDALVESLPMGLDTPCHERGVTLSSGERQLIALARAFFAAPRVLVLDEATSSLDLATEAMVERALDVVLEGRTAIVIAHRLNTAKRADRIGVVEDGRLVEVGRHEELLERGGRYARMFEAWMQPGQAVEERAEP